MHGEAMKMKLPGRAMVPVARILVLVLGGIVLLAALQRQLIFFPQTAAEPALLHEADRIGLQPWRDRAGALIGWRAPGREGAGARMLVLHGNAGYALHRLYYVQGLHALGNSWDVILFEYPGYGARTGTASADSFRDSATAAVDLLLAEDDRPLYLLGESLGSGVASYLAASLPEQVAGLLLVTPFTSLADVAAQHYPVLPIRALLRENFDSAESLQSYAGPGGFPGGGQRRDRARGTGSGITRWLRRAKVVAYRARRRTQHAAHVSERSLVGRGQRLPDG